MQVLKTKKLVGGEVIIPSSFHHRRSFFSVFLNFQLFMLIVSNCLSNGIIDALEAP